MTETVLTCYNRNGNVLAMDITAYATAHGGTAKRGCPVLKTLAQSAGCSPDTLYMIAIGHKQVGYKLAQKIVRATSGEISCHDLRPDIWPTDQSRGAAHVA